MMDTVAPGANAPLPPAKGKKAKQPTNFASGPSVEVGAVVSLMIITLYLYGFVESIFALPDVPILKRHLGGNLNLALDEYDDVEESTSSISSKIFSKIKKAIGNEQKPDDGIPEHIWPATIRNEDQTFDTILHPANSEFKMSVPKFWLPPVHNGELMSRDLALKIGSCNEPDPITGSRARGDDCPPDERTIYLAIASYRDFQCRFTLESAFMRAKNPLRIRVGVVDQIVDGEDPACNEPIEPCESNPNQALCKYQDRVDVYEMEAGLSVGPVFARHIGHRMYRGEYYYTQSDAHVSYTTNWDADITSQIISTKNEMAVLTSYLTDVQGSIDPEGHSKRITRPIMCNTDYEGEGEEAHLRHLSQPEFEPAIHGSPQLEPYWAAGYSFSRGHFVVNVPYDLYQPMIFQGEEMSIGIRAFTIGYDFYAPERSVCFHHYAVGKNAKKRNKVPHFWDNAQSFKEDTSKKAMARLLGIVHMNPEVDPNYWDHTEEDFYGLGGVRTPEKFYETFGVDVIQKKAQHHLCLFVEKGHMHKKFQQLIRPDGMGVNYDRISFKFIDPLPNEQAAY